MTYKIIGNDLPEEVCQDRYLCLGQAGDETSLFDFMTNLKSFLEKHKRRQIAIPRPEGIPLNIVRKTAEYILHNSDIKMDIYRPSSESQKERRDYVPPAKKTSAIIINSQGRQYSELLKQVKEGIIKEGANTSFRGMRKTKQGNLLIEFAKESTDQIAKVSTILRKNVEGVKLRVAEAEDKRRKQIQIRDLDLLATEGEILDSIQACNEEIINSVPPKILSVREVEAGRKTALVEMEPQLADKLIEQGLLTIGMIRCRTREWIPITRCYRCWGLGHVANKCTGDDRSNHCRKCGKPGHETNKCGAINYYCPLCQTPGHKAGSAGCRTTQKMMRELRNKGRKRR